MDGQLKGFTISPSLKCGDNHLHNINAHTKFGENLLTLNQVIIWKLKYGWMDVRMCDRHQDRHADNQHEIILLSCGRV